MFISFMIFSKISLGIEKSSDPIAEFEVLVNADWKNQTFIGGRMLE